MSNLRETTRLRSGGGAGWYGATAVTGGSGREKGTWKRSTAPVGFPESWRMLYLEAVASKGRGEREGFRYEHRAEADRFCPYGRP